MAKIYGGRVGFGIEWEEEVSLDMDTTKADLENFAKGLSEDFMTFCLEDGDQYDYWYEWEEN